MSITKILKRVIPTVLVLLLAVVMLVDTPVKAAEAGTQKYISELAIESGTDAAACKKKLTDAGFTVVDQNLNEGNSGDYSYDWYYGEEKHTKTLHVDPSYSYMGYKITTDSTKAIRKISAMTMNTGYRLMTYRDMMQGYAEGLQKTVALLQRSIAEFKVNYAKGTRAAKLAYTNLNVFVVPEAGNMPLGDYLMDSARTTAELTDIILIADSQITSFIYNQLAYGVADDVFADNATTFYDRLCTRGPIDDSKYKTYDELEEFYEENYDGYFDSASALLSIVQSFAESYVAAIERHPDINSENNNANKTDDMTPEERVAALEEQMQETSVEDTDDAQDAVEQMDAYYISIYDTFNAQQNGKYVYQYGTNEDGTARSLAQFLVEIGTRDVSGTKDYNTAVFEMYPWIVDDGKTETPLTDGQLAAVQFIGLVYMVIAEGGNEESFSEAEAMVDIIIEKYADVDRSVWAGVNRSIYDEQIAVTSAEYRSAAAKESFSALTKTEYEVQNDGLTKTQCLLLAGLLGGVALITIGAALLLYFVVPMIICACTSSMVGAAMGAALVIKMIGGYALPVLVALIIIAAIVFLFIALDKHLDFKKAEKNVKDETTLTPIPTKMYDEYDDESVTLYKAVMTADGSTPGDLNAGKGDEWVALYYTTDSRVGSPILVSEENGVETAFTVDKTLNTQKAGLNSLAFFGDVMSANLNKGAKVQGITRIFLYYKTVDGPTADEIPGKYVKTVRMFSDADENVARESVRNAGCYLIDCNLTPNTGMYTFIGYTTTDLSTKAMTDLRFSYSTGHNANGDNINFGGASYGTCGGTNNLILWQTSKDLAGSPILTTGFHVVSDLADKEDGWEGVNLFCGGEAYDIAMCGNNSFDGKGNGTSTIDHIRMYLFFECEEQYKSTDPDATEYIGGLMFFAGSDKDHFDSLISSYGFTKLVSASGTAYDFGHPSTEIGDTYLCYSTTYNPKRAIYNLTSYEYEPNAQQANYSISTGTATYAAVDVIQSSSKYVAYNDDGEATGYADKLGASLRYTHAYITNSYFEYGGAFRKDALDINIRNTLVYKNYKDELGVTFNYDGSTVKAANVYNSVLRVDKVNGSLVIDSVRVKALYVTGNYTGGTPIKVGDLILSDKDNLRGEYTPVRSITDWYSETAANLAYNDYLHNGQIYLYINRPDADKPMYIASAKVIYSDTDYTYDDEGEIKTRSQNFDTVAMKAASNGAGTLIQINLTGQGTWENRFAVIGSDSDAATAVACDNLFPIKYSWEDDDLDSIVEWATAQEEYDINVAYIYVTYTDDASAAISDLYIRSNDTSEKVSSLSAGNKAFYTVQGDVFQTSDDSQYYTLYSMKLAAKMVDIVIDHEIMTTGYMTVCSTDKTTLYEGTDDEVEVNKMTDYDTYYIKIQRKTAKEKDEYVTSLYIGTGDTPFAAKLDLINHGCRYCTPINISSVPGKYAYVGMVTTTVVQKAMTGMYLEWYEEPSDEASISFGKIKYNRLSDNLDALTDGSYMYLFGTKNATLAAKATKPKAQKRYIDDVAFFYTDDLNDYCAGAKFVDDMDEELQAYTLSLIDPFEYYLRTKKGNLIVDENGDPAYEVVEDRVWSLLTDSEGDVMTFCSPNPDADGNYREVYVYVHYTDNSDPTGASLAGSVFSFGSGVVIVVAVAVIAVAALVVILVQRKKKSASATVADTAEIPADNGTDVPEKDE